MGGVELDRWAKSHLFRSRGLPVLTCDTARDILEAAERGLREFETSIDAGLSRVRLRLEGGSVIIGKEKVGLSLLEEIAQDERSIYALTDEGLHRVEAWSDGFYKLVRTGRDHAPTLEINGIHMHRVKGTFPEIDSQAKVMLAGRDVKDSEVLDTCTGLGYTAIWAVRLGAKAVLTVEVSPTVIQIAELNPWSRDLESDRIQLYIGDTSRLVRSMPDGHFHVVIHDPPRLSLAGELYSEEFYLELKRVLKPGGVLVHYVGSPGGRFRGLRLYRGVMERLRSAGFSARFVPKLDTVLAVRRP
jgi:predicted methyltransferase